MQQTRSLSLRNVTDADLLSLHQWNSNTNHLHLWSQDRRIRQYDDFTARFNRSLKSQFDIFNVIVHRKTKKTIGFVYNYNGDLTDRNCYLCVFIDPQYSNQSFGIQGAYLLLKNLFSHFGFRKVYAEVFAYNLPMLKIARALNMQEEGLLKEYRWYNNHYWDQHIFSLSFDSFQLLEEKYKTFLG